MSLREFLRVAARWWPLMLSSTIVAAGLMWLITPADLADRPQVVSYTAASTLLVNPKASLETEGNAPPPSVNIGRIALLVQEGPIPVAAAKAIAYEGTPAELAKEVSVTSDTSADAIVITASGLDGERAAEVVNAFGAATVEYFKKDRVGVGRVNVSVLQEASPIAQQSTGGFVVPPSRTVRAGLAGGRAQSKD